MFLVLNSIYRYLDWLNLHISHMCFIILLMGLLVELNVFSFFTYKKCQRLFDLKESPFYLANFSCKNHENKWLFSIYIIEILSLKVFIQFFHPCENPTTLAFDLERISIYHSLLSFDLYLFPSSPTSDFTYSV